MEILGYRRPDGRVGIRNHIAIIPTSVCSSTVAANIAAQIPGAVAIANQHGCCQIGADHEQTMRTLIGLGRNPNVAAILVIGLGCEGMPIREVASEIAASGKPVETLVIQEVGGTLKATAEGLRKAGELARKVAHLQPEKMDLSELVLAIECGGSDFTSGLASNPACGIASDLLVAAGGTSMLSETTEFIGAEHILARRCKTLEIGEKLIRYVQDCEDRAKLMHVDIRGSQPTPGNIAGGISSIEEKSLGCIHKAGHAPIQDVLAYGEAPSGKGLYVMDSPGQDVESITGMVAGGATIVIFTTGRGTPTGCPIAPVIKITGNARTFIMMEDNMDIDASTIISGEETIEHVGQRILDSIVEVANGHMPKAESLGHKEFGIYKIAPTY
ncbi:UxaA family hydrolase [Desulfitobacterium sp.]|uniref:UxaA family hydrolase n=1 Tax=Desulfitobacterium sp. TaxID=49981 RepID=UPI002BE73078|nr:UxaA family hydrolase [Desulfitobacterium sp.]HVJ49023.1 UxaA family hydrolase [Desulfitobacterium sp.]